MEAAGTARCGSNRVASYRRTAPALRGGGSVGEFYRLRARARIRGDRASGWLLAAAFWAAAGLVAGSAAAEEPATRRSAAASASASADARAAARAHFEAALVHYRAHRYREAIREFELSAAAVPNADIWFDIGRAHERLGELAAAIDSYERYLRDRTDAADATELRARIAGLRARIDAERTARARRTEPTTGSLAIDAGQPGARVALDGREIGTAPLERVLALDAGTHEITASGSGFAPYRARVDVQPGAVSAAYVRLVPVRTRAASERPRLASAIIAGASGLALVTGGALAIASGTERDAHRVDRSDDLATASRVSFGAALGLAVGAMLAYVIEGSAEGGDGERAADDRRSLPSTASLTLSKSR